MLNFSSDVCSLESNIKNKPVNAKTLRILLLKAMKLMVLNLECAWNMAPKILLRKDKRNSRNKAIIYAGEEYPSGKK